MARFLKVAGAGLAFVLYVWVVAVRAAPRIRARKDAKRMP
jgi:hypothetical protein